MRSTFLGLSAVFFLSLSQAQGAELLDATDPNRILEIAKGFGFAELETDDVGDPLIAARMDSYRYVIFFNGCADGANCTSVQFTSVFTDSEPSLQTVNAYNSKYLFGSAYIDGSGNLGLAMPLSLKGGVAQPNFERNFELFATAFRDFRSHFELN